MRTQTMQTSNSMTTELKSCPDPASEEVDFSFFTPDLSAWKQADRLEREDACDAEMFGCYPLALLDPADAFVVMELPYTEAELQEFLTASDEKDFVF